MSSGVFTHFVRYLFLSTDYMTGSVLVSWFSVVLVKELSFVPS